MNIDVNPEKTGHGFVAVSFCGNSRNVPLMTSSVPRSTP